MGRVITARMRGMEKCPGSTAEARVNERDGRADVLHWEILENQILVVG